MANCLDKMYIEKIKHILTNMSDYSDDEVRMDCWYHRGYAYGESKSIRLKYYVWKLHKSALKKRNIPALYHEMGLLYLALNMKRKALKCFEIADKMNVVSTWWLLAQEYTNGDIVKKDKEKALMYFEKMIEVATHGDLVSIARMFDKENTIITDHNKAIEIYKKSALMGNNVAIIKVILHYHGIIFSDVEIEQNEEINEVDKYYIEVEKSLETKYNEEQNKIKKAKKEDLDNLYYWTKVGADFKNKDALFYMGYYHLNGIGCKKSEAEAFYYYKEAAECGCNSAYYMLGCFYFYGDAVEKNHNEAMKWFIKANPSGFKLERLGDLYFLDEGVKQDYSKAFTYYYRALEYKLPSTYYKVGLCYENGYGCEINYDKAREYYELALEGEYEEAKEKLKSEKIRIEV